MSSLDDVSLAHAWTTVQVSYALNMTREDMQALTQTSHLLLFAVLVAGIVVLPGMDMAFVMGSALADGRKGGLSAVAGVVTGGAVHVFMAATGISLAVRSAPHAFNVALCLGSAYIGWLGWTLLRGNANVGLIRSHATQPARITFQRGLATTLLNPKAYLFMLAIFPQFLRPEYGSFAAQAVILGVIICSTQLVVYGFLAIAAVRARQWIAQNRPAQIRLGQVVGGLLIAIAVSTGFQGWQNNTKLPDQTGEAGAQKATDP